MSDGRIDGIVVGDDTELQLTVSGVAAPRTWSIVAGALPDGLTLSTSGVLAGSAATLGDGSVSLAITGGAAPAALRSALVTDPACEPTAGGVVCDIQVLVDPAPPADARPATPNGSGFVVTSSSGTERQYAPVLGDEGGPVTGFAQQLIDLPPNGEWDASCVVDPLDCQYPSSQTAFAFSEYRVLVGWDKADSNNDVVDGGYFIYNARTSSYTSSDPVYRPGVDVDCFGSTSPQQSSNGRYWLITTRDGAPGEPCAGGPVLAAVVIDVVNETVTPLPAAARDALTAAGGVSGMPSNDGRKITLYDFATVIDVETGASHAAGFGNPLASGDVCGILATQDDGLPVGFCQDGSGAQRLALLNTEMTVAETIVDLSTSPAAGCGFNVRFNPLVGNLSPDGSQILLSLTQPGLVNGPDGPVQACVDAVAYRVALDGDNAPVPIGRSDTFAQWFVHP